MGGKAAILTLLFGLCSAQLAGRGSRSFSGVSGGSRFGSFSSGSLRSQHGVGSQRVISLNPSRRLSGTIQQRASLLSTGHDVNFGGLPSQRTISVQRPVASQSRIQLTSGHVQQFQPDAVSRHAGQVSLPAQTVVQPATHMRRHVQIQPAAAQPQPVAIQPAQPAAPAPQPAPVAPVQPAAPAAPVPAAHVRLTPAAGVIPGAYPGSFMGINPMNPMGAMMNPMGAMMNPMGAMMNPMGMGMGMMSPMGMGMGMGGFPMSYDTMEDLYLDPDRPDPVRVVPPVGGMAARMPVAMPAGVPPAASAPAAGAATGVNHALIASALQTALSKVGQRQGTPAVAG